MTVCWFTNDRYVLLRDPIGEPLCAVVKETMAVDQLPAGIRDRLAEDDDEYKDLLNNSDPMPVGQLEKTVDVFMIKWKRSQFVAPGDQQEGD